MRYKKQLKISKKVSLYKHSTKGIFHGIFWISEEKIPKALFCISMYDYASMQ